MRRVSAIMLAASLLCACNKKAAMQGPPDGGSDAAPACAADAAAPAQVAGDCKRLVCTTAGTIEVVNDDTDVADDGNACTRDTCNSGVNLHTPVSVGATCAGGFCDRDGTCAHCLTATQCGSATDCSAPSCDDGTCGATLVASGTALPTQTVGDCKRVVCNGGGGTSTQNDDGDVPDDGNPCTDDGCNAGSPTHVALTGQACGSGGAGVCNALGQCVGCNTAADCPGSDGFCKVRSCSPPGVCGFTVTQPANTPLPAAQQAAGDCVTKVCDAAGNVQSVAAAADVPVDGNPCTDDLCGGTTPSNPPSAPGTACAAASCNGGVAQLADTCDGAGACVDRGSQSCGAYACGATACNTSCAADAACAPGYACDTGLGVCTNGPKCTDYCAAIAAACTAGNQQYTGTAQCLGACADLPRGAATDAAGDTVGCRATHAGYAATDPVSHCPHAGPTGGGVCGDPCESFCTLALAACTGPNLVYAGVADCMAACAGFATTPPYSTATSSGNSYACRVWYLMAATVDPASHCPHIALASATCQ